MNITRNGKIARLPHALREELNQRLLDGESGRPLLAWLNALPAVQAVLAGEFEGRPINAPNLTAWRQHGYREWRQAREARAVAEQLSRDATREPAREPGESTEALAQSLAAHYFVATSHLRQTMDPAEHWRLLHEMSRDLTQLRRGDLHARRLALDQRKAEFLNQRAQVGRAFVEQELARSEAETRAAFSKNPQSPINSPSEGNEGE